MRRQRLRHHSTRTEKSPRPPGTHRRAAQKTGTASCVPPKRVMYTGDAGRSCARSGHGSPGPAQSRWPCEAGSRRTACCACSDVTAVTAMTSALGLDLFPFPKCPVSASQGDRARARIDRKSFCGNDFRVMARFAPCARRGRLQRVPLRQGAKRGPAPRRNRPTDAGVREPTAESGKRRTTGRGRRAEDTGPRAESRGRTTESGEHKGRRAKGAMRRRLPSPALRVRGRGECMWHVKRHAASMRTAGEPCGMCSAVKREACPRRLLPRPVLCVGVPSGRFLRLRAFPGHLHSGCVRGTPGATAGVPALQTPDDDVGESRRLNPSNPAIPPSCPAKAGLSILTQAVSVLCGFPSDDEEPCSCRSGQRFAGRCL